MKARVPFQHTLGSKKAMMEEITKQILERDTAFAMDSDASLLWAIHEVFGFGKKRLRRLWEKQYNLHRELRSYYAAEDYEEMGWIYREKLKNIGVDVEDWYKELKLR